MEWHFPGLGFPSLYFSTVAHAHSIEIRILPFIETVLSFPKDLSFLSTFNGYLEGDDRGWKKYQISF